MATELKTLQSTYCLTVRFNDDDGSFQGASVTDLLRTFDGDGKVINAAETEPRAVTQKEFTALLGKENTKIIAACDQARAERDEALAQAAEATSALEAMKIQVADMAGLNERLNEELERMKAKTLDANT